MVLGERHWKSWFCAPSPIRPFAHSQKCAPLPSWFKRSSNLDSSKAEEQATNRETRIAFRGPADTGLSGPTQGAPPLRRLRPSAQVADQDRTHTASSRIPALLPEDRPRGSGWLPTRRKARSPARARHTADHCRASAILHRQSTKGNGLRCAVQIPRDAFCPARPCVRNRQRVESHR